MHDVYRRWRAVADEYGDRPFVGEVFVSSAERLARYVRPDELHTAFDFRFLQAGWDATRLRREIDDNLHDNGRLSVFAIGSSDTLHVLNKDPDAALSTDLDSAVKFFRVIGTYERLIAGDVKLTL